MLKIKDEKYLFFVDWTLSFNFLFGIKGCRKGLRNEKVVTTDEFLVKKRNPLVLPPNFEDLPEPGSKSKLKKMKKKK